MCRVLLEFLCDRAYRIGFSSHKTEDIQIANHDCSEEQYAAAGHQGPSMWLVAMHVQLARYEDVEREEETSLI